MVGLEAQHSAVLQLQLSGKKKPEIYKALKSVNVTRHMVNRTINRFTDFCSIKNRKKSGCPTTMCTLTLFKTVQSRIRKIPAYLREPWQNSSRSQNFPSKFFLYITEKSCLRKNFFPLSDKRPKIKATGKKQEAAEVARKTKCEKYIFTNGKFFMIE